MVARVSKKDAVASELHGEVLPSATRRALEICSQFTFLKRGGWYLAGGTALALQVGHRQSVDLDFFLPKKIFSTSTVEGQLVKTEKWKTTLRDEGTLYGLLDKAKMSLIAYPFFHPSRSRVRCGAVSMLIPADIAVMKIIAISQRGRKRDFIDLFWLCYHGESLGEVLRRVRVQYPQDHNVPHILKSLSYFDDAEGDPMPTLFFKTSWSEIKAYFRHEVPRITRQMLRLAE